MGAGPSLDLISGPKYGHVGFCADVRAPGPGNVKYNADFHRYRLRLECFLEVILRILSYDIVMTNNLDKTSGR